MPADSEEPLVGLPHRFRPFGVRFAGTLLGSTLLVVAVTIWLAFPGEVRAQFTLFQRITVIAIGLAVFVFLHALARSRVDVDAEGLTVVNGYRSRRLEWGQVVAVSLRSGSPWAVLDLDDGTTLPVMGIQGSDGQRALRHVRQVRRLLESKTRTERDD